jgi:hypothetical protein
VRINSPPILKGELMKFRAGCKNLGVGVQIGTLPDGKPNVVSCQFQNNLFETKDEVIIKALKEYCQFNKDYWEDVAITPSGDMNYEDMVKKAKEMGFESKSPRPKKEELLAFFKEKEVVA